LESSGIRKIFDMAKDRDKFTKIAHFEIGRPHFSPPKFVKDAILAAVDQDDFHYTPSRGTSELRSAICNELRLSRSLDYCATHETIVTVGASEGVAMTFASLLSPGDEVIVPTPAWPHYKNLAKFFEAKFIEVPTNASNDYRIDVSEVKKAITSKTKLLVLNNPSNPTGSVHPKKTLEGVLQLAQEHSFFVLADEIYDHFAEQQDYCSFPSLHGAKEVTIYINGFSKAFGMTGLRIGYLCAPKDLISQLTKVHQYLTVCSSSLSQRAALEALTNSESKTFLSEIRSEYKSRLDKCRSLLRRCDKLKLGNPTGAMYFFIEYPAVYGASHDVCMKLVEKHDVAVVPGVVFGDSFDHHFRLAYTPERAELEIGIEKILDFFKRDPR
jgi:aspartate/methionine/tyrosine aminotransferase